MINCYGRSFQESRSIVLKRDDYTCTTCGKRSTNTREVVVHHLDYTSNAPENLTTLCISCHKKLDGHPCKIVGGTVYKTITVKDGTHARLRQAGISGESMDIIINRALDCLESEPSQEWEAAR